LLLLGASRLHHQLSTKRELKLPFFFFFGCLWVHVDAIAKF
jgi:hypothetical protein